MKFKVGDKVSTEETGWNLCGGKTTVILDIHGVNYIVKLSRGDTCHIGSSLFERCFTLVPSEEEEII